MKALVVSGNKYPFRSVYIPFLKDLSEFCSIRLVLMDYPENYPIGPLVQELMRSGSIEKCDIVPCNDHAFRHHRALGRLRVEIAKEDLDLLVVNADFIPLFRYFIEIARLKGAKIAAVQDHMPTQLLASYAAVRNRPYSPIQSFANDSGGFMARFRRITPWKLARFLRSKVIRKYRQLLHFDLLPRIFLGQKLEMLDYEKNGSILFATTRVDMIVVYSDLVRDALRHFVPGLKVVVAAYPLRSACRCRPDSKSLRLLVVLGGPWQYFIRPGNSAEDLKNRWCNAIHRAVGLNKFTEIHIRPHPRETAPCGSEIVQRLSADGLNVRLLNPHQNSIPEIICDYVGMLSAPSAALAEAIFSCRRAFVVVVEDIEDAREVPEVRFYGEDIALIAPGKPMMEHHFAARSSSASPGLTVADAIRQLLEIDQPVASSSA